MARNQAITPRNYRAGFKATEIHPFDPSKGLNSPFLFERRELTPPPPRTPPPALNWQADLILTPNNHQQLRSQLDAFMQASPSSLEQWDLTMKLMNAWEQQEVEKAQMEIKLRSLRRTQPLTPEEKQISPVIGGLEKEMNLQAMEHLRTVGEILD